MTDKIKSLQEIEKVLENHRSFGRKIVHCHGVFDLLHPGHVRHFQEAKRQGDILVVSLTPDRFVNKGPGRPAFHELLRLETIAALRFVDYVVLNDAPDAVPCIKKIKPHIYVKGKEYENHTADVTGKISEEVQAVREVAGDIYYTDDIVFSSSSLLNRYFDPHPEGVQEYLRALKERHTLDEIMQKIEDLSHLKVLIVGDAIIDIYQYVNPLGQSGKGLHMTAQCLDKEVFLGGSLIVANHVAEFTPNVTLLTAIGKECPHVPFIKKTLNPQVETRFIDSELPSTLVKKRYVLKDGKHLSKLFETYSSNQSLLANQQTSQVVEYLKNYAKDFDLVLVPDFGNGFTNPAIIEAISQVSSFLAINTQINSGNRGFNVATHYQRANYISLNEPELRLAAHNNKSPIEDLVLMISEKMKCPNLSVTRGVKGVVSFTSPDQFLHIPALTTQVVDRVGAGDSFLALSALSFAKGYPPIISSLLGSIAAAMDVQIVGNKEPVKKAPLCKYLTRLMK